MSSISVMTERVASCIIPIFPIHHRHAASLVRTIAPAGASSTNLSARNLLSFIANGKARRSPFIAPQFPERVARRAHYVRRTSVSPTPPSSSSCSAPPARTRAGSACVSRQRWVYSDSVNDVIAQLFKPDRVWRPAPRSWKGHHRFRESRALMPRSSGRSHDSFRLPAASTRVPHPRRCL